MINDREQAARRIRLTNLPQAFHAGKKQGNPRSLEKGASFHDFKFISEELHQRGIAVPATTPDNAGVRLLRLQFLHDAGAVAVLFGVDAESLQHCQPHIAQWCVLRQDEVPAQFQAGSAAGEDGRAIGQVVDGADVRSEGHGGVLEEARPVGFLRGLEFVDQAGQ